KDSSIVDDFECPLQGTELVENPGPEVRIAPPPRDVCFQGFARLVARSLDFPEELTSIFLRIKQSPPVRDTVLRNVPYRLTGQRFHNLFSQIRIAHSFRPLSTISSASSSVAKDRGSSLSVIVRAGVLRSNLTFIFAQVIDYPRN